MPIQLVNLGTGAGSGDGDSLRVAFKKINDNFVLMGDPIKVFKGIWTPTNLAEYPDDEPVITDTWIITDVDPDDGYSFTSGDLIGVTVYNGNEIIFDGNVWKKIIPMAAGTGYLLKDGSILLDIGYVPSTARSIATKGIVDAVQTQVTSQATDIFVLQNQIITKTEEGHSHLMADVTDATWISNLSEDLTPSLSGNLDVETRTFFSSTNGATGTYGLKITNISGSTNLILTSASALNSLTASLNSSGASSITATKALTVTATDGDVIVNTTSGSKNIVLNGIKLPNSLSTSKAQVLVSDSLPGNALIWKDVNIHGSTAQRPVDPAIGTMYYDETLAMPVWCTDNTPSANVWQLNPTGTSAQRPVDPPVGTPYFDTTLGYPIWCKVNTNLGNVWVNASGDPV